MDFDEFLSTAAEKGLPPFSEASAGRPPARMPDEKLERVRSIFSSYRSCIAMLNGSEHVLLEELVAKATRTGDYIEEDLEGDGETPLRPPTGGGATYVKKLDGGRNRVFHFPARDNVQFQELDELRDRALQGLLVALGSLAGR
jgi:hypothetical protein